MYHPFWFSWIQVEYRAKHRKEGSHGLSMLGRPDIEMAKKAAKLSSQVIHMGKWQLSCEKPVGRRYSRDESAIIATKEILSLIAVLSLAKLCHEGVPRTFSLISAEHLQAFLILHFPIYGCV